MSNSSYDIAQICCNGHVITSTYHSSPQLGRKFCDKCGAHTITQCQYCSTQIRGYYHVPGYISSSLLYDLPAFCPECGKPYPWTESKLKAAQEFSEEIENLDEEERSLLKSSLDDIIRDTTRTTVAAYRFKGIVAKSGQVAAEGFKNILIGIVSETVKKIIWPSS